MRVTARAVYVAMTDFLVSRRPHLDHLHIEVQGLPGQRMVEIHIDRGQADLDYGNRPWPETGGDVGLLTRAQGCGRGKILLRNPLAHVGTPLAIGLLGRHRDLEAIAGSPPLERLLQAGDYAAVADQYRDRFTVERGLGSLGLTHRSERIMETYDVVVFDLHARPELDGTCAAQSRHYPDRDPATPAHGRDVWWLALLALLSACTSVPRTGSAPPASQPATISAVTQRANEVTLRALGLVGTPYVYGGNTPQGGFDCSGLVTFVFADAAALRLPRTTAQMAAMPARPVKRDALRTGDLVFFSERDVPSHVGIYVGNGRFVHAPNEGGTVRLDALSNPYWNRNYRFSRRVID